METNGETNFYVEKFMQNCTNRGLSKNTIRWYRGILTPFETQFPNLPDTPEPLEAFIASFKTGDERRYGVFRVLRAFYYFNESRHEITNPVRKMRPPRVKPKEKQTLSIEQLRTLLEYPGHNDMVRALLSLLVDTGIRLGEAAGLTGQDIGEGTVRISGKTGQRVIPVSPQVKEVLLKIMPPSTAKDQRLFPFSTFWLGRLVTRAIKAAGLEGFSGHHIRHSFCTLWKGSDTALKHITGHKSWKMIEHYKHKREAQASEQHQVNSPIAQIYSPTKLDPESEGIASPCENDKPYLDCETLLKLLTELGNGRKTHNDKKIELIIHQIVNYYPENEEWPEIEKDGEMVSLMPFIALAIIPAVGWKAVFAKENGWYRKPLTCFALVKHEDGTQDVRGTCACCEGLLDSPEHHDNFLGYEGPEEKGGWSEQWKDWHDRMTKNFKELSEYARDININ